MNSKLTPLMARVIGLLALVVSPLALRAGPDVFTLDSAQSRISISGKAAGNNLASQGKGSLETSYTGKLLVLLTDNSLQLVPSSRVDASTNGVWSPAPGAKDGVAPADYGAVIETFLGDIDAAIRNLVTDLASPAMPLIAGTFDASPIVFSVPADAKVLLEYKGLISGSTPLAAVSTNRVATGASLTTVGGTQVLTIPVDAELTFTALNPNDSKIRLLGKLVATRPLAPAFSGILYQTNTVTLTASIPGGVSGLQSSTDLKNWTSETVTPDTSTAGLAKFTVPVVDPAKYYRVVQ